MLRTPPKKAKRRSNDAKAKKKQKPPGPERERLKPISLWGMTFDDAIDGLLRGRKGG